MDRNIGLEAVRLTEAAAMASARVMGRGDEKLADQAAVDAMRKAFNDLHIRGTTITATGGPNALSVIAMAEKGNLLNAPDTYMDKIAVGPSAKGAIDLT